MARKWSETIEEEVTGERLNKTGKGFDNISGITYGPNGVTQIVGDGYTYNFTYNALGYCTKITEVDGATPNQEWVIAYDSDNKVSSITNNQLP